MRYFISRKNYWLEFRTNKHHKFFSYQFIYNNRYDWRIRISRLTLEVTDLPF